MTGGSVKDPEILRASTHSESGGFGSGIERMRIFVTAMFRAMILAYGAHAGVNPVGPGPEWESPARKSRFE